jgi:hypothetical protein
MHFGAGPAPRRAEWREKVVPETVENKLERLERRVTNLEELPARMDRLELQILQFRDEVRAEFSAVRTEIRDGDVMVVTALTEQIEETRRHTSVLFEDAVGRIAVVGEGLAANAEGLKALDEKVDTIHMSLTRAIDATHTSLTDAIHAARVEMRAALEGSRVEMRAALEGSQAEMRAALEGSQAETRSALQRDLRAALQADLRAALEEIVSRTAPRRKKR